MHKSFRFVGVCILVLAYVIDLRARFPASVHSAMTPDGLWRTHALRLENEYASLKAKYEVEKMKTLALSATTRTSCVPESSAQSVTEMAKRKSRKKNAPTIPTMPPRLDLRSVLEELNPRSGIPILMGLWPGILITALDSFFRLASSQEESRVPPETLLPSGQCALDAIRASLKSIIECDDISKPQLDILKVLDILTQDVIVTALPTIASLLPANGLLDSFISTTRELLLLLIHSFLPLSVTYLQRSLLAGSKSSNTHSSDDGDRSIVVDVRADILVLFRNVLCNLFGSSSRSRDTVSSVLSRLHGVLRLDLDNLRLSLALEAIRELDCVLFSSGMKINGNSSNGSDRESDGFSLCVPTDTIPLLAEGEDQVERTAHNDNDFLSVKKLAVKDTLWYLCTLLHVLSGDNVPPDSEANHAVDNDRVLERSANAQPSHLAPSLAEDTRIAHEEITKSFRKAVETALLELVIKCQKSMKATLVRRCREVGQEAVILTERNNSSPAPNIAGSPTQGKDVNGDEPKVLLGDHFQRRSSSLRSGSRAGDLLSGEELKKGFRNLDRWPQVMTSEGQNRADLPIMEHSKKPVLCPVDEMGYGMILGVVERYLMGRVL